jgi:sugar lactone lactonase YvrE
MPNFFRAVAVAFLALIAGVSPILVSVSTVDAAGQVLVADQGSGIVMRYSTDGTSADVFASGLSSPSWITIDRAGNVYVSEHDGLRISKFSPTGVPLLNFPTYDPARLPYYPGGVQVGADGAIYVADYFGGNVYRYSAMGENPVLCASGLAQADFMALDATGNLYVTDPILEVVRRFDPTGVDFGDFVSGFPGPAGIAFDASGILYVASFNTNIIQKYAPPQQCSPVGCKGVDQGMFASLELTDSIMGMAFDADGNLYVANYAEGNVHRFSSAGLDLGVFASTGLAFPRDAAVLRAAVPVTKEECKQDGWESFDSFKNQGDCIQFLNTGK